MASGGDNQQFCRHALFLQRRREQLAVRRRHAFVVFRVHQTVRRQSRARPALQRILREPLGRRRGAEQILARPRVGIRAFHTDNRIEERDKFRA